MCLNQSKKHRLDGFLLIELMVIILMSSFLIGVATHWQGLIIQSRHGALNRLKMTATVRNLIEQMQTDRSLVSAGKHEEGDIAMHWRTEPIINNELDKQLPFIKQPLPFQLVCIEASWQGSDGKKNRTEFVTGFMDAET